MSRLPDRAAADVTDGSATEFTEGRFDTGNGSTTEVIFPERITTNPLVVGTPHASHYSFYRLAGFFPIRELCLFPMIHYTSKIPQ